MKLKIIAGISVLTLALAVPLNAVPMDTELQPGTVIAHKDFVKDENGLPKQNEDGSYTIELSVKGKNTTRKIENADVMFIATHSNVNGTSITPSHNTFIKKVIEEGKGNRVGIVTNCSQCASENFTNDVSELERYIAETNGKWTAETYERGLSRSLGKAIELLNQREDTNRPVYVFITGIKPGLNDITDPAQIEFLKMNRTHTILLGDEAIKEEEAFKEYGDVACVPFSDTLNQDVERVLVDWANEMFIYPANAGEDAVMTDVVNTDDFDYVVEDEKLEDDGKGNLTWNIGTIPEEPVSATFKVTPKPQKHGNLKTNKDVSLKYTDYLYEEKVIPKEDIGDPELFVEETFTVTYSDGVNGEVFENQVFEDVVSGSETPKFTGKTDRDGYVFKGWSPAVSETVTGDIEYVAQWEKVQDFTVTYSDGVDDANVFDDVVFNGLKAGDKTPEFTGSTDRDGYTFEGWTPEVEETVTKSVVYTAMWKEIEDPKPQPVTYTVTYSDGANGEVFASQTHTDLVEGSKTPLFEGELTRNGYTFMGWSPKVSETVIGDVTYVAQWKEDPKPLPVTLPKTGVGSGSTLLASAIAMVSLACKRYF